MIYLFRAANSVKLISSWALIHTPDKQIQDYMVWRDNVRFTNCCRFYQLWTSMGDEGYNAFIIDAIFTYFGSIFETRSRRFNNKKLIQSE